MKSLRETAVVGLILLALACVYAYFAQGCSPAHQGVVLDVAGHSLALRECRAEGRDAGSYLVYSQCADEADWKFGLKDGGL